VVGVAPCGYPLIWASTGACPYNKPTMFWKTAKQTHNFKFF